MGKEPLPQVGRRYGRLEIIGNTSKRQEDCCGTMSRVYICRCDCGNIVERAIGDIRRGVHAYCGECEAGHGVSAGGVRMTEWDTFCMDWNETCKKLKTGKITNEKVKVRTWLWAGQNTKRTTASGCVFTAEPKTQERTEEDADREELQGAE